MLSKLLEQLVVRQLRVYLTSANLLPSLQSGFRPCTIVLLLSDMLQAVDCGDFAALVFLGLSVAFDAVDHEILRERLQSSYSTHETVQSYHNVVVLQWFRSR